MLPESSRPALSVVVVSFNRALQLLEQCLHTLASQHVPGGMEIVVVRVQSARHADHMDRICDGFPQAIPVRADTDATVPQMRRLGVARSRGDIVALIEDDCVVNGDWAAEVLRAHGSRHIAVGGAVEPGKFRSGLDWAAYFCDYGRFMLPFEHRETCTLPGNNVSYKRSVISELLDMTAGDGLQEVFVHQRWCEEGRPMLSSPSIVVRNEHRWSVGDLSAVPFFHARAYGARRARAWGIGRRAAFAFSTAALPPVHFARIVRRVISRKRGLMPILGAAPWIGMFALSWAAGELLGYAAGPGDSARHWR